MGSPLENLERRQFKSKVRSALLARIERGGRTAAYTGGPTAGQFGVMSSSLPTAQERGAFNERIRDRALYGSYGKGGILREQIAGNSLAEIAKRQMTPYQRAQIKAKARELGIKDAELAFKYPELYKELFNQGVTPKDPDPLSGPPTGPPPGAAGISQQVAGAPPLALANTTSHPVAAQTQRSPLVEGQPALREAVPSMRGGGGITVPPVEKGGYRDPAIAPPGTYSAPGEYDPGLGARIRAQIEGGGQRPESLADFVPPPGGQHPETRMALPVDYDEVPLRDVVPREPEERSLKQIFGGGRPRTLRPASGGDSFTKAGKAGERGLAEMAIKVLADIFSGPAAKPDKASLTEALKDIAKKPIQAGKTGLKKEAALREWLRKQSPSYQAGY